MNAVRRSVRDYLLDAPLNSLSAGSGIAGVLLKTEEEQEAFIARLDAERARALSSLEVAAVAEPESLRYASDSWVGIYEKQLEALREMYGADEAKELAAFFRINGLPYGVVPLLLRYGDRWYVGAVSGTIYTILGLAVDHRALAPLFGTALANYNLLG